VTNSRHKTIKHDTFGSKVLLRSVGDVLRVEGNHLGLLTARCLVLVGKYQEHESPIFECHSLAIEQSLRDVTIIVSRCV
jgi:hypothetical protein